MVGESVPGHFAVMWGLCRGNYGVILESFWDRVGIVLGECWNRLGIIVG